MAGETLNKAVIEELLGERKKDRRWRIIRFSIVIALIIGYIGFFLHHATKGDGALTNKDAPYVSLIRLNGPIMPNNEFSAQKVIPLLNEAFRDKKSRGVVLEINSPGGSPVQSAIIHDKIIALKKKYPKKKVTVIGEDALASGAYLIAVSADKIVVNPDTITGSIGVVMSGFGLQDAIKKLGISRRVYTAGDFKARLDPFEPVKPADIKKVDSILQQTHQDFINIVEAGRKGKLKGDKKLLFSGDFWLGTRAVQLGLVDQTGNLWDVLKDDYGVEQYKEYKNRASLLKLLSGQISMKMHAALSDMSAHLSEQL